MHDIVITEISKEALASSASMLVMPMLTMRLHKHIHQLSTRAHTLRSISVGSLQIMTVESSDTDSNWSKFNNGISA